MALPRYPSPHEQLRRLAISARARGLSFDDFWDEAIRPALPPVTTSIARRRPDVLVRFGVVLERVVIWPQDTGERRDHQMATCAAREGWRRAYQGETPTRGELALSALGPALEHLRDAAVGAGTLAA